MLWYPGKKAIRPIKTHISNTCVVCGVDIQYRKKHCIECVTNIHKETQRHHDRLRDKRIRANGYEFINYLKVFDRDKWICKLCHTPTPKDLIGKVNPHAPTLDHIIPISKGGPHTYSNVQLLCRSCNGKKSNKLA